MYERNVGVLDRIARFIVGAALLPVGLVVLDGAQGAPAGIVVAVLGGIGLASAFSGRCPGYVLFGVDTRRRKSRTRSACSPPACCGMRDAVRG